MAMTMKRIFCMSLHRAALIFGYFCLICSLGELIGLTMVVILLKCSPQDEIEYNIGLDKTNTSLISSPNTIIARLVFSVCNLFLSLLLIIGVRRKSHKMLSTWLTSTGLFLIVLICLSLWSIFMGTMSKLTTFESGSRLLIIGLMLGILSCFLGYNWIGIYLLFRIYHKNHREILAQGEEEKLECFTIESPQLNNQNLAVSQTIGEGNDET